MTLLSPQERPPGPHSRARNKLSLIRLDQASRPIQQRDEQQVSFIPSQELDLPQAIGLDFVGGGCSIVQEPTGSLMHGVSSLCPDNLLEQGR